MLQKQAADFLTPGGVNDRQQWKRAARRPVRLHRGRSTRRCSSTSARSRSSTRPARTRSSAPGRLLKAAGLITSEPDYESLYARRVLGRLGRRDDPWAPIPTLPAGCARRRPPRRRWPCCRARPARRRRPRPRRLLGVLAPLVLLAAVAGACRPSACSRRGCCPRRRRCCRVRRHVLLRRAAQHLRRGRALRRRRLRAPAGQPGALRHRRGRSRSPWSAAPSGCCSACRRLARDLLDPVLNALRAVPLFAWLPLVLIWFGIGEGAARALIFLGALWPVLVATADATARVPGAYVETARMLGTSAPRPLAGRSTCPAPCPRCSPGCACRSPWPGPASSSASSTAPTSGVGAMMNAARETGRTEQVIVGIFVFAAVGLTADLVLRACRAAGCAGPTGERRRARRPRPDQVLRRPARARRRRARGAARAGALGARPERLRQVDAAAGARRLRAADLRRGAARRRRPCARRPRPAAWSPRPAGCSPG